MKKKVFLLVLIVLFLFSTHALADVIKLKLANYFPPMHMNSIMMGKYCDELNKKLDGKVVITQYTGGTLLGPDKMAAGVLTGITDIGLSNLSYTRGRFPVMEIMDLPFGFPSAWIAGHVANDFYARFKPKEFGKYKVLMFSTSPINVIQTISKPVKTLEDMKGLKLRGTGRIGDIVKALGGIPIPVSTPEMYESMRKGVIEGALLNMEPLKGFNTGEIVKYVTASWKIGSAYTFYVLMNKQKWDKLPADVKKIIEDHTAEFIERWTIEWNNIDIEGKQFFLSKGGKIITLSEAENAKWINAAQPVIDDYKKNLMSRGYKAAETEQYLNFIKERIEYWKKQEKARKIPTSYQY